MGILKELGTGQGYVKAGFLGFNKSGKSYTAMLLACGIKKHFKLPGPIVMFDTEGGSEYLVPLVRKLTGGELIGVRSRAFDDLMAAAREAEQIGASVFLVDSITHPWREVCDSHLKAVNEVLRAKGRGTRSRLELPDWNPIKQRWQPWPDWYLSSAMHNIVCGRAGDVWADRENEETGKVQATKVGIKMKTEGEFGFEPSLLVEMAREQEMIDNKRVMTHRATVIGDRFGALDGAECDNPTFDFFLPHIKLLTPGAHSPVDTDVKSVANVDESGDTEWQQERKTRTILCEEIRGEMERAWPGQTAGEKKAKLEAIEMAFGTRSWTRVESLESQKLREGLAMIKARVERVGHEAAAVTTEEAA